MRIIRLYILFIVPINLLSQAEDSLTKASIDNLYIYEVQDKYDKDKVLHAEPLYIDLIRDLGARKGEREWNVGLGMTDKSNYDSYEALIEFEWAPMDRLGLEIELPFQLNFPLNETDKDAVPSSSLESFKMAMQWSFLVNEKYATSMAIGYIHEFEFSDFRNFGNPLVFGNVYNPFFVAAKRWGNNFHTLIYTGPAFFHSFKTQEMNMRYEMHTNFHYMIPGTRNFIGLEVNKYFTSSDAEITLRPQMRIAIADNFLIGIVPSIPMARKEERLGMFLRLIWEPKDHHK